MNKKPILLLVVYLLLAIIYVNIMTISSKGVVNKNLEASNDKIHFIATGCSDAILIESNGKFTLIDAGEDTGTSKKDFTTEQFNFLNAKGYEEEVIQYLKSKGVEALDFVIATHSHSDHIGGMDSIFENFTVNKLYTREYNESYIDDNGNEQELFRKKDEYIWDNKEVYNEMINAAENNNIQIVYIDGESTLDDLVFSLGDFKIQIVNNNLYNSKKQEEGKLIPSENSNSLGVIVSKNNLRAFLAGDIDNEDGDEDYLISDSYTKEFLKDIDLLKIAHHGINGTSDFIEYLNPKITVVTGGAYFDKSRIGYNSLKKIKAKNVYTTQENSNIEIIFNDNNTLTTNAIIDNFDESIWNKFFN